MSEIKLTTEHPFWSGKRVLITGHTGFKGAWLTFWLSELGAVVHGLALEPSTQPSAFEALGLAKRCNHRVVDIRDADAVNAAVNSINPQVVFHMAAQPLVRESYRTPMETYATNVMGTGNVLMALRECPATRSIVVITTDKCYENREWHWGYRESDPMGGYDPYSSSKACTEILTASFRRSFFSGDASPGLATVRAGNVIGGGDWSPDRLIPDIVRAMQADSYLQVRYPQAIRPWQHVLAPLSGYMKLAKRLHDDPRRFSEAFNFAPVDDDCVTVQSMMEIFGQEWGRSVKFQRTAGVSPHEAHFLKLDASKARAELGWEPNWRLRRALQATADWYRCYYEKPEVLVSLTRNQIENYLSAGKKELA